MPNYHHHFRTGILIVSGLISADLHAQQRGEIENQTYEIVKQKSIEFPAATQLKEKVQPFPAREGDTKVQYQFADPSINLPVPRITPAVVAPTDQNERMEQPEALNNYIKLGAGNYGRFLGEAFVSGRQNDDMVYTGEIKHLSANTGPVDGKNSANSNTLIRLGAKYLTSAYKVDGSLEYNRRGYYFYGYGPQPADVEIDRDSIRQRTNLFGFRLGLSNTDPSTTIDYSLVTSLKSIRDRYSASELDWGTNLSTSLPITEDFFALFEADAYVSQLVDAETSNRNLFRVKPAFKYVARSFFVTVGVNAVNETDRRLDVNRTKAFPVLNVDFSPMSGVHFFAGWNGDVVRNTLRSLLSENQWIGPNVLIANTIKDSDLNAGVKGEMDALNFEAKVSYAKYRNFYFFNNSLADLSKFSILYEGQKANVLTISGDFGYNVNDLFKTNLKAGFYNYALENLEEPWHRPKFTLNWFNAVTISRKLFFTTEFYVYSGIKAKNFQTGEVKKLPSIADLNLKIDYLLTKNFSAFVNLNNILGRQYERYQYYPAQGLNFIGGLSFSF